MGRGGWLIFNLCLAESSHSDSQFYLKCHGIHAIIYKKKICSHTYKKLFRVDLSQHFFLQPQWVEINEIRL